MDELYICLTKRPFARIELLKSLYQDLKQSGCYDSMPHQRHLVGKAGVGNRLTSPNPSLCMERLGLKISAETTTIRSGPLSTDAHHQKKSTRLQP
jgi:hypothetical protein